jgi:hypothetical protein
MDYLEVLSLKKKIDKLNGRADRALAKEVYEYFSNEEFDRHINSFLEEPTVEQGQYLTDLINEKMDLHYEIKTSLLKSFLNDNEKLIDKLLNFEYTEIKPITVISRDQLGAEENYSVDIFDKTPFPRAMTLLKEGGVVAADEIYGLLSSIPMPRLNLKVAYNRFKDELTIGQFVRDLTFNQIRYHTILNNLQKLSEMDKDYISLSEEETVFMSIVKNRLTGLLLYLIKEIDNRDITVYLSHEVVKDYIHMIQLEKPEYSDID